MGIIIRSFIVLLAISVSTVVGATDSTRFSGKPIKPADLSLEFAMAYFKSNPPLRFGKEIAPKHVATHFSVLKNTVFADLCYKCGTTFHVQVRGEKYGFTSLWVAPSTGEMVNVKGVRGLRTYLGKQAAKLRK